MLDMVLEDDLGCAAQSGTDRGKLDEHIRAVLPVLDHFPHMLQMPNGSCKAVQNRLGLGMDVGMIVAVGMGGGILVEMLRGAVAMNDPVAVIMIIELVFVHNITVLQFSVDHKDSISGRIRQVAKLTNPRVTALP